MVFITTARAVEFSIKFRVYYRGVTLARRTVCYLKYLSIDRSLELIKVKKRRSVDKL